MQGSLQRWLGDVIQVDAVRVETRDSALLVTIEYVLRRNGAPQIAQFVRGGGL